MRRVLALLTFGFLFVALPSFADKIPTGSGAAGDPPSVCDAIAGNLVTNCAFETGDFTGWALTGPGPTLVANNSFGTGANSGTFFAALGAVGADDILTQTLTTTPGATYNISFYFASDGGTPNDISAFFNGDLLYSATNIPAQGYQLFSFTDVATGGSTVLQFNARNDPSYNGLDDVSVTPLASAVPEPCSILLVGTGLAGLLARRNRKEKNA